jgi:hypothetical protein
MGSLAAAHKQPPGVQAQARSSRMAANGQGSERQQAEWDEIAYRQRQEFERRSRLAR